MYAKKHRPMQKLTAICLSVTIAAASLLSGHVFASDEAPQTDYLTGWALLAELREMGLGQDVILDEEAPESDNSSETNTEDPSDTTGEPGDGDQTDGTEPSNPDGNNPGEGGSGEGDTDTDTDPGTDNPGEQPDNSDPAASTDPDEGDDAEQGSNQNQPSAPAESTESASGEVPLVTQNDEMTVNDPQTPGETPAPEEDDNTSDEDKIPEGGDTSNEGETPEDDNTSNEGETPENDNTSNEGKTPEGGDTSNEGETPEGGDTSNEGETPENSPSQPESSEGELPETSGITEEQRAALAAYVQTLEAEQVVSLDGTDITVQEYEDLCSMLTAQQFYLIDLYLNPPKIPQNVTTPEGLVETPEPVRPFRLMSLMAARNDTEPVKTDGLVTSKTATMNEEGTEAAINLEAYVSGEVESGTESVPLDIVLVLDQSGSMEDVFESVTSAELVVEKWEGVFILGTSYWGAAATSTPLYYLPDGGNPNNPDDYLAVDVQVVDRTLLGIPYRVQLWCDLNQNGSYEENEMISDTPTGIFGVYTPYEGVDIPLYQKDWQVETETQIKLNALKESVQSFITSVEEDAAETGAQHRIAIVGFASEYGYGNNTEILSVEGHNTLITGTKEDYIGVAYGEITNNDYRNALQDVTDPDGQIMLDNATNSLAANGATRSDLGMDMAEKILNANPVGDSGRKQVVIMFTDGTPTTSNQFSTSVANGAVSHAGNMKDNDVTVYTIGIFEGAQPLNEEQTENNLSGNENRYMHAVSSNYPNAESYMNHGSSANTPPKSYYLSARDADTLNTIFENIYHEIVTPSLELGRSAVLKDVVSDYFQLPEGFDASDVTVEVWNATENGETPIWVKTDQTLSAIVDKATKTVSVTGFDYSANAVVKNSNGEWQGKKLVVSFAVEPHDDFLGGNAVPTNDSESGVYDGNTVIENFDVPSVNVPIHYSFNVTDKTIYLSNSQTVDFGNGEVFYDNEISAILLGGTARANDYVNITYTVTTKNGAPVGTYKIPARGTGSWTGGTIPSLTPEDCEELVITCTVTSKNEAAQNGSLGNPGKAQDAWTPEPEDLATKPATVHVLKPTFHFQDSYYSESQPNDMYPFSANRDKDFVTWSDFAHPTGIPEADSQKKPLDSAFTLTFDKMSTTQNENESETVVLTESENFKVNTVTMTVDSWEKTLTINTDYKVAEPKCSYVEENTSLEDEHVNDRHFTIHLPSEFDLTITKTLAPGSDYTPGETFRFKVSSEETGFYTEFTLGGTDIYPSDEGWSITITGLKRGTYTIEEDTSWSWRYQCNDPEQTVTADDIVNNQKTVTFTNTKTNNHWLSWEDTIQNIFKAS